MNRTIIIGLSFLSITACDGGFSRHSLLLTDEPPKVSSGTPAFERASAFVATDAVWSTGVASGFDFGGERLLLALGNRPQICSAWVSGLGSEDAVNLVIALAEVGPDSQIVPARSAATYQIEHLGRSRDRPAASFGEAYLQVGCGKTRAFGSVAGRVTLDSVGDSIAGSYDFWLNCSGFSGCDSQESIELVGSFSALQCGALDINHSLQCSR